MSLPIVIGITGASGAAYAVRVIELLAAAGVETHLAVSALGKRLLFDELDIKRIDADQLTKGRGDLLIVHGTGDDNVHFQSTEQLVNALVAAGKQFQIMAYPNRTHGIYEGAGTTPHLYNLLTKYLKEHLPAGPRGATTS